MHFQRSRRVAPSFPGGAPGTSGRAKISPVSLRRPGCQTIGWVPSIPSVAWQPYPSPLGRLRAHSFASPPRDGFAFVENGRCRISLGTQSIRGSHSTKARVLPANTQLWNDFADNASYAGGILEFLFLPRLLTAEGAASRPRETGRADPEMRGASRKNRPWRKCWSSRRPTADRGRVAAARRLLLPEFLCIPPLSAVQFRPSNTAATSTSPDNRPRAASDCRWFGTPSPSLP